MKTKTPAVPYVVWMAVFVVVPLLLIVNFREMHQTKQAEKRDKALQKDGVKGGTR